MADDTTLDLNKFPDAEFLTDTAAEVADASPDGTTSNPGINDGGTCELNP